MPEFPTQISQAESRYWLGLTCFFQPHSGHCKIQFLIICISFLLLSNELYMLVAKTSPSISFQKCRRGVVGSLLRDSRCKIWVSHATCLSRGSGETAAPHPPRRTERGRSLWARRPLAPLPAPTGHPDPCCVAPSVFKAVAQSFPGPESLTLPLSDPGRASCLCFLPEVLWVQVSSFKSLIHFECIFVHDVRKQASLIPLHVAALCSHNKTEAESQTQRKGGCRGWRGSRETAETRRAAHLQLQNE